MMEYKTVGRSKTRKEILLLLLIININNNNYYYSSSSPIYIAPRAARYHGQSWFDVTCVSLNLPGWQHRLFHPLLPWFWDCVGWLLRPWAWSCHCDCELLGAFWPCGALRSFLWWLTLFVCTLSSATPFSVSGVFVTASIRVRVSPKWCNLESLTCRARYSVATYADHRSRNRCFVASSGIKPSVLTSFTLVDC